MAVCGNAGRSSSDGVQPANISLSQASTEQKDNFNFATGLQIPLLGSSQKKRLTKGVYQIKGFVDVGNSEPVTKSDFIREFEVDGQLKKVRFKRVNIGLPKNVDGKKLSEFTAVFSIDENPIPIPFIIYGILGATGLGTGGYFISQVNRFTESSFNQFLTIAGIAVTAYFAIK